MYLDMVVHAYTLTIVRLRQETYKFLGQLGLRGELLTQKKEKQNKVLENSN